MSIVSHSPAEAASPNARALGSGGVQLAGPNWRSAAAEGISTALLLAIVVGSGIMGERLAGGNVGIALLANSLATGAGLVALVCSFDTHMNPAVTLAEAMAGGLRWRMVPGYALAQVAGAFVGVALAHAMFDLPWFAASTHERSGSAQGLGELVATFSLVIVVLACTRSRPQATPYAVGSIICAGYWFTSSTSFANPAVTLARAATDTFTGIRAADVPLFVLAEVLAAIAAVAVFKIVLARAP
jgi:glycerol uptake facilitator-like aquaporin